MPGRSHRCATQVIALPAAACFLFRLSVKEKKDVILLCFHVRLLLLDGINILTVVSCSPSDDGRHLADKFLAPLRIGRQADGLDVVAKADGPLQPEEGQVVVETRPGELRMNADLADLKDVALAGIRAAQVVLAETGRVLVRPESFLTSVQGAVSRRHDEPLVDESPAAPKLGAFGSVEVNGRHPRPSAWLGQLSTNDSERRRLHLSAPAWNYKREGKKPLAIRQSCPI